MHNQPRIRNISRDGKGNKSINQSWELHLQGPMLHLFSESDNLQVIDNRYNNLRLVFIVINYNEHLFIFLQRKGVLILVHTQMCFFKYFYV